MDSLFFCLGMLYEYLGRPAMPNETYIERFFVGDQEGLNALVFEDRLIRALKENWMSVTFDKKYVAVHDGSKDFFIDFVNEDIVDWFNGYFLMQPMAGLMIQSPDGSNTEIPGILLIDPNKIVTPTQKLSYLCGAFVREGVMDGFKEIGETDFYGGFRFANSAHKFEVVSNLLRSMDFDIEVIENAFGPPHTDTQSVPAINIIKIHPAQIGKLTVYN